MNKHTHFIAGNWHAGEGHHIQSVDPAKKNIIWQAKSAAQVVLQTFSQNPNACRTSGYSKQ